MGVAVKALKSAAKQKQQAPALSERVLLTTMKKSDAETRVTLHSYKDKWSIDVRRYWMPDDADEMKATGKGASIPLEDLPELITALQDVLASQ